MPCGSFLLYHVSQFQQKWNKIEKFMAPQNKKVKNSKKNKPPNATNVGFQTLTKFLLCFSIVIRIQR
jgi:hypothetical protein